MLPTLLRWYWYATRQHRYSPKNQWHTKADTAFDNLLSALDYAKLALWPTALLSLCRLRTMAKLFCWAYQCQPNPWLSTGAWLGGTGASQWCRTWPSIAMTIMSANRHYRAVCHAFCDSCNRLRVSSQGKVHLCLFDRQNDVREFLASGDVTGLKRAVQNLMPIKPEHHHLHEQNSGLMNNLSMIGG